MSNIKLGSTIYSDVDTIKVPDADNIGQYISFTEGGGGITGGYNVTFNDGTDNIAIVSVEAGGAINSNPIIATKTGYVFKGWSTTSGGTTAISFPYTPAADLTVYAIFGAE